MTKKNDDPLAGLSAREREVMNIVHRRRTATAADVRYDMADPPTDATVRSVLRVLEEKGWLTHDRDGARFVYRPVDRHDRVATRALRHLMKTFYGGSPSQVVSALVGSGRRLSSDERERLREMLEQLDAEDES